MRYVSLKEKKDGKMELVVLYKLPLKAFCKLQERLDEEEKMASINKREVRLRKGGEERQCACMSTKKKKAV